ncbi:MAG TPA: O-antigen ligase family protein [Acidimicrobiia bacterium]|jgi:hypothetical protein|nr:O-antigen ligase family protein [Acidimicrobiia bacterium]
MARLGLGAVAVAVFAVAVGLGLRRIPVSSGWALLATVPVLIVVGFVVARGPRACLALLVATAVVGLNRHLIGGQHGFRVIDIFWLGLVGWTLSIRAREGRRLGRQVGQRYVGVWLAALLVSLYPVAVYTPNGFTNAFISWARLAETISVVWLVPYALRTIEDIEFVFGVIEVSVAATIVQAMTQYGPASGGRLGGGSADTIGLLAALLLGAAIHAPVPRRRPLRAAMLVLGLTALLLTRSVGSLVAAGVMLGVFGFQPAPRRSRHAWLLTPARLLLLVLAVGATAATLRPGSLPTSKTFGQSTALNRTVFATAGLDIFRDHPIVGVGWSRGPYEMGSDKIIRQLRAQFGPSLRADFLPTPGTGASSLHNTYIEILAEAGLIGFGCLVALFLASFGGIRAVIRSAAGDPHVAACAWCAAALLVGVLVWLNDNALFGTQPETVLAATFLGVLAAVPHVQRKAERATLVLE